MDIGYYASRALLSKLDGQASAYLLERNAVSASAPVVNSLVSELASRFGIIVSERLLPVHCRSSARSAELPST